jgi:hypothetical protein
MTPSPNQHGSQLTKLTNKSRENSFSKAYLIGSVQVEGIAVIIYIYMYIYIWGYWDKYKGGIQPVLGYFMGSIGFYGRFYEVYVGIFKELICRNIFFDDIGEIFLDIPYNGTFLDIMTYV